MNRETSRRTAAVAVPMAVMLVIGSWGLDRGGIWRDEAATFQVARRTVPQIWRLLHEADAVHGLYYLLLRPVLAVHPGEVLLRLPSLLAAAVTAGLVAALGTRLARPRVGLWAGLLYAVTPMVGHYAQEGRSYAMVAAGAAGATLLLVRAAGGRSWTPYGVVLAFTCLLHEFAVLLLLAHAATLALGRVPRRVWTRWLCAAGAVVLVLLPLALVSHAQSAQVAWLRSPGQGSVDRLVHQFAGPTDEILVPCLILICVALRRPWPKLPGRELPLPAVALPLLLVPPAVLMTVSQWSPLYDDRYVLYALAGAPLLAAAGADRIARAVPRLPRATAAAAGVLAVAVVCAHHLPLLRQDRSMAQRGGENLATASALAARELRPGDPVLFLPSIGRRSALAYPRGFRGTRDVALAESARTSGTLYGVEMGPEALRRQLAGLDRVWLVAEPYALRPTWYPGSPAERVKRAVVEEEFEPRREFRGSGVTLRLYERRPTARPGGARGGIDMRLRRVGATSRDGAAADRHASALRGTGGAPTPPASPRPRRW
ncbi:glycosyltransferase family 39 protein [Streptomyces sp. ADMS]|uniref:glycosyltransferase family 39 protein n=1 Tax=Streptomyces sp. ADMS TaxID=3071415 RepID=UPI00296EB360|nr:glycosyltransferase family 39 protein [Streptomyces sp. ADMS]MDW4905263.1 glycosyltransferase family 39 protein [Streptomyces sp. ADMS]